MQEESSRREIEARASEGSPITTDLIRSMAVSSAELWHDVLRRLAELQQTQAMLTEAVVELGSMVRSSLPAAQQAALGGTLAALPAAVAEEVTVPDASAAWKAPDGDEQAPPDTPHRRRRFRLRRDKHGHAVTQAPIGAAKAPAPPDSFDAPATLSMLPPPPRAVFPPPPVLPSELAEWEWALPPLVLPDAAVVPPTSVETEPFADLYEPSPPQAGSAPHADYPAPADSSAPVEPPLAATPLAPQPLVYTPGSAHESEPMFDSSELEDLLSLDGPITGSLDGPGMVLDPPVPFSLDEPAAVPGAAFGAPVPGATSSEAPAAEAPAAPHTPPSLVAEYAFTEMPPPPAGAVPSFDGADPGEVDGAYLPPPPSDVLTADIQAPAAPAYSASMATEILASAPPQTAVAAAPSLVINEDLTLVSKSRKRRLQFRLR